MFTELYRLYKHCYDIQKLGEVQLDQLIFEGVVYEKMSLLR